MKLWCPIYSVKNIAMLAGNDFYKKHRCYQVEFILYSQDNLRANFQLYMISQLQGTQLIRIFTAGSTQLHMKWLPRAVSGDNWRSSLDATKKWLVLQCQNYNMTQRTWKRIAWWRHWIVTFSASLAFCEGNTPVTGEFPSQRSVTRNFGVFFDLRLNKRLSKPSRRGWFETPSRSLWSHRNGY